jgi:hypothetical protein
VSYTLGDRPSDYTVFPIAATTYTAVHNEQFEVITPLLYMLCVCENTVLLYSLSHALHFALLLLLWLLLLLSSVALN